MIPCQCLKKRFLSAAPGPFISGARTFIDLVFHKLAANANGNVRQGESCAADALWFSHGTTDPHRLEWVRMLDLAERKVDYLRISVTDRCNERCLYCLPEGFQDWRPRLEILSYEEILGIVRVAVALGFRKFRVTGGEPLLRREVEYLIGELVRLPGVISVSLSTNGLRLADRATALARAGLQSVNVSLDALDPDLYRRITGENVAEVIAGIAAAQAAGIRRIKLNTVLMRDVNESQIWPLIHFAAERGLWLRFIELMPVSQSEVLSAEKFFPMGEVKNCIRQRTVMEPDPTRRGHGPAQYYRLPEFDTVVGFIGAMTHRHFCRACNKMRLTADGKIRPCLGDHLETDLMPALRPILDEEGLQARFRAAGQMKPVEHSFRRQYEPRRIMTAIGG
jgi:cyclic pyranopterin phosphate synthase